MSPIHYSLDAGRGLLRTQCVDEIRAKDLREHFDALLAEPALPPELRVLIDATGLRTLPGVGLVRTAGDEMVRLRARVRFTAVAVVVSNLAAYGVFRMSEALLAPHFGVTHVFRDGASAEAWLEALPSEKG